MLSMNLLVLGLIAANPKESPARFGFLDRYTAGNDWERQRLPVRGEVFHRRAYRELTGA
jgi:hypothetical protein